MFTRRCLVSCALFVSLSMLAGCASEDRPVRSRDARGGFSVLVETPDHPAAARVITDIGVAAQAHGFVRAAALPGPPVDPVTHESVPSAPERYQRGNIELEVSYQPTTHRITAYLHSSVSRGDRRVIDGFYRDFDREYGGRYGANDPISESGYSDESAAPISPDRPDGASVPGPGGGISAPGSPTGAGLH